MVSLPIKPPLFHNATAESCGFGYKTTKFFSSVSAFKKIEKLHTYTKSGAFAGRSSWAACITFCSNIQTVETGDQTRAIQMNPQFLEYH